MYCTSIPVSFCLFKVTRCHSNIVLMRSEYPIVFSQTPKEPTLPKRHDETYNKAVGLEVTYLHYQGYETCSADRQQS